MWTALCVFLNCSLSNTGITRHQVLTQVVVHTNFNEREQMARVVGCVLSPVISLDAKSTFR